MKVNGSCHCGAISYEATVDPQRAGICHCTDCQTLSGAPFRASVPAKADAFHLLKGQPKRYVKTADSGEKRVQAFCAECGTPLYACAQNDPSQFNLRLGAIKQRDLIPPVKQIWCQSALSWSSNIEGVTKFERG